MSEKKKKDDQKGATQDTIQFDSLFEPKESVNLDDLPDDPDLLILNLDSNLFEPPEVRKGKEKKKGKKKLAVLAAILVILVAGYLTCVYSSIPFIAELRELYIETAMGTKDHKWLATMFIPASVINEVMDKRAEQLATQKELESVWETESEEETDPETLQGETEIAEGADAGEKFFETYWELDSESFHEYLSTHPDQISGGTYDHILFEDFSYEKDVFDVNGYQVCAIDTANNLLVVRVKGSGYEGKLAIVKDSSQVDLVKSATLGSVGQIIDTLGNNNGAIVAINCSRFTDAGGHGNGGDVQGSLIIDGVEYGHPRGSSDSWKFFGMKDDNKFYITNYSAETASAFRWGAECLPALVVNGASVVDGSFGMGLQPRAVIGQAQNGDFMMLIIDGRQTHSIGTTVGVCAQIMINYHAYQAMDLDGGSSAVMWYKGKLVTKPSSVSSAGRYLPDAIVIRRAQ